MCSICGNPIESDLFTSIKLRGVSEGGTEIYRLDDCHRECLMSALSGATMREVAASAPKEKACNKSCSVDWKPIENK